MDLDPPPGSSDSETDLGPQSSGTYLEPRPCTGSSDCETDLGPQSSGTYLEPRLSTEVPLLEPAGLEVGDNARNKNSRVLWSHQPLVNRMIPIIRTLQAFSFYPLPLDSLQSFNRCCTINKTMLLWALFTVTTLVNFFCAALNYYITNQFKMAYGIWSEKTLTSIVTGLKPLVNLGHLLIMAGSVVRHRAYLRELMMVDNSFAVTFACDLNFRLINGVFFAFSVLNFLIPLSLRMLEYWLLGETPGEAFLNDISVVLVPLLSVWNVLPLVYFWAHCYIIRRWFITLQEALHNDIHLKKRNLRFYYRQYLKLTHLLSSLAHMFNPFIFFTIAWTVLTLCLTIYFATQVTTFIQPTAKNFPNQKAMYVFVFNMLYCVYQVIIAVVFLGVLCLIGTATNETARGIVRELLRLKPAEADPIPVICFMEKIQVQYIWGISVWRAVPMERSLMFTVVSAVVTYGLLLLKLKGGEGPGKNGPAPAPVAPALNNLPNPAFVQELVYFMSDPNLTCIPVEILFATFFGRDVGEMKPNPGLYVD